MSGWDEQRVATLRKLWAEGLSAAQVAKQLGGVTRNAVIGKVHRLGLQRRAIQRAANANKVNGARLAKRRQGITFVPTRVLRPTKREKLRAEQVLAAALPPMDPGARITDMLAGQCRYINGDPLVDATICGRATQLGAWCVQHTKLVYQPSNKKPRPRSVEGDELRRQARRENWSAML